MGWWERWTGRVWEHVPESHPDVVRMPAEARHMCYRQPMSATYTHVRWNDGREPADNHPPDTEPDLPREDDP